MRRDRMDDPGRPLLASGEQVEETPEGPEEHYAYGRSHQHQDGC